MAEPDRTYYGIQHGPGSSEDEWEEARILVEQPAVGPTERENAQVLAELLPQKAAQLGGFGWGYNGGGTSRAAAAILADALDLGSPDDAGMDIASWPTDETRVRLREAFCCEVLSQFHDSWRLRRAVVLRWAHSWYIQHAPAQMPPVLRELPALL